MARRCFHSIGTSDTWRHPSCQALWRAVNQDPAASHAYIPLELRHLTYPLCLLSPGFLHLFPRPFLIHLSRQPLGRLQQSKMVVPRRIWSLVAIPASSAVFLFCLWTYGLPKFVPPSISPTINPSSASQSPKVERPPGPIYKDFKKDNKPANPIHDPFAIAEGLFSRSDFPAIPSWNKPPETHVPEITPLFIGFTRNWPLLQQCVLSYITAGWPPEDIYVVDNTGTMKSNFPPGKLTLQNPFYLNVERLTKLFGVNVIATPTLLTFAQLQNFYLFTAQENKWEYYFWGHMDVLVTSDEDLTLGKENHPPPPSFKSFYLRAVDELRKTIDPSYALEQNHAWALRFFAYDWLALNNVTSFMKLDGWDTFVSFYMGDCDMHERIRMSGMKMETAEAGWVFDVGRSIDLSLLFRRNLKHAPQSLAELAAAPEDTLAGSGYEKLHKAIDAETEFKAHGDAYRNAWQVKQQGGVGEPFYRDPRGFADAMEMAIKNGVDTYHEKWGRKTCDLKRYGYKLTDAWMVEHEFDEEKDKKCT
ncbi:hypothetical protein PVAG01_11002 [Phlyctema vagabunda]|uniref:Uncharacterized protein n=1 Tax=Phlyctema vagabunda TaxID=108571 RepID=A0ABR4P3U6_9HELO